MVNHNFHYACLPKAWKENSAQYTNKEVKGVGKRPSSAAIWREVNPLSSTLSG